MEREQKAVLEQLLCTNAGYSLLIRLMVIRILSERQQTEHDEDRCQEQVEARCKARSLERTENFTFNALGSIRENPDGEWLGEKGHN